MQKIEVVSAMEIDGKEVHFSDLTPEECKKVVEKIQDNIMCPLGYRRTA